MRSALSHFKGLNVCCQSHFINLHFVIIWESLDLWYFHFAALWKHFDHLYGWTLGLDEYDAMKIIHTAHSCTVHTDNALVISNLRSENRTEHFENCADRLHWIFCFILQPVYESCSSRLSVQSTGLKLWAIVSHTTYYSQQKVNADFIKSFACKLRWLSIDSTFIDLILVFFCAHMSRW